MKGEEKKVIRGKKKKRHVEGKISKCKLKKGREKNKIRSRKKVMQKGKYLSKYDDNRRIKRESEQVRKTEKKEIVVKKSKYEKEKEQDEEEAEGENTGQKKQRLMKVMNQLMERDGRWWER